MLLQLSVCLLEKVKFFYKDVLSDCGRSTNFGRGKPTYKFNMDIERLTTLAFSMYSNRGAYALLLGSGISCAAHIPSGWKVEEELIQQLALTQGIAEAEDWHQWYEETYHEPASYSALLEALVKTSTERVQLMRPFFEPTDKEKELGWKSPTKAHYAIARLMKAGSIRVILTTNFDRLLEKALESEGVTPQVISSVGAIAQATPIMHSKVPTIVKINGDYLDCEFRNTAEELKDYPDEMRTLLSRIFEDFGLITCGWSAEWDKGLIQLIEGAARPRYNSFFAYVGEANKRLSALSNQRAGELLCIENADQLFTELCEQVLALEKYNASRNMTHEMMIARVKKYLSLEQYDIEFADLVEKWRDEAFKRITEVAQECLEYTPESFAHCLDIHFRAVTEIPLLETAILTARWGKKHHLQLFGDVLIKLCMVSSSYYLKGNGEFFHALAPTLLLNTLGVACVKYGRFAELNTILCTFVPSGGLAGSYGESLLPLLGKTPWDRKQWDCLLGKQYQYPFSRFYLDKIKPVCNSLFASADDFKSTYYIWEHFKALLYGYNKCYMFGFHVPTGMFYDVWKSDKRHPSVLYFNEAEKQRESWEPIKQGLFGGSYDEYKAVFDQVEKYLSEHGYAY